MGLQAYKDFLNVNICKMLLVDCITIAALWQKRQKPIGHIHLHTNWICKSLKNCHAMLWKQWLHFQNKLKYFRHKNNILTLCRNKLAKQPMWTRNLERSQKDKQIMKLTTYSNKCYILHLQWLNYTMWVFIWNFITLFCATSTT